MPDIIFADPATPGLARQRHGRGFAYRDARGGRITDPAMLERIRLLVIPPAWRDVWICPDPRGHIQAVGRDEKGRRQYIYHADFRAHREAEKFERLATFAKVLPRLRRQVLRDLEQPGLTREKVLATVVYLLDRTLIRIGNETYARENGSFGLSTMRSRHASVRGETVRFTFTGKSGKAWSLSLADRRVGRVVRRCQDLPGQHLFQYRDGDGVPRTISSEDVNAYLRDIARQPVSAKDFRTWGGSVLCTLALSLAPPAEAERQRRRQQASAIRAVAQRLGNTPAVCRASYVHPQVFSAHEAGLLFRRGGRMRHGAELAPRLTAAERTLVTILTGETPQAAGSSAPIRRRAPRTTVEAGLATAAA
jgi:DNA topoisomerase-1